VLKKKKKERKERIYTRRKGLSSEPFHCIFIDVSPTKIQLLSKVIKTAVRFSGNVRLMNIFMNRKHMVKELWTVVRFIGFKCLIMMFLIY
jgi:hypothetical protein